MQMDNRIILAGQQPDIMGSFARGMEVRANENALAQQNAVADLYRKQGAQILSGDEGALNALAGFDPQAALGIQSQQQQNAYAAEDQQMQRDRLQMDRDNARIATQEALAAKAAELTAEQVAQEAADLEDTLSGAAFFYQNKDQAGYDAFLRSKGADPAEYPFQAFPAHAAKFGGALDAMKTFAPPAGPAPTDDMREFQYAQENPEFADYQTAQKKAGAASTTVNNTMGATGDGSTRPGQVFDEMKASTDAAKSAVTGLRALQEAERALKDGAITGFAADWRLSGAKLGALLGLTDPQLIQNTETFRAAIAPQVAAMIKATVGSAQLSNADREFAEKAAGGNISLDEGTINRLLDIMTRASTAAVESHTRRLNEVYPDGSGADRERALFSVTMPGAADRTDDGTGIGTVEDGFRYIGGDSSTPEAWEPAQ